MVRATLDLTTEVAARSEPFGSETRLANLAADFDAAVFRFSINADGSYSIG